VILAADPVLEIDNSVLPGAPPNASPPPAVRPTTPQPAAGAHGAVEETARRPPGGLWAVEREHILAVLKETGWVIEGARGAARILELHPNTLRSRLKKLGLHRSGDHETS